MSPLFAAAACFAERIKINALSHEQRGERLFWIKRRRRTAPFILAGANRFFTVAGSRIQAIDDLARWQRWEVDCFLRLHGDRFHAFAEGSRTVAAEALPGVALSRLLDEGRLTPAHAAAAARELNRAHTTVCPTLGGGWSHGDPHAGNFLYDTTDDRARIIDFELMHDPTLSTGERHAEDLLTFLQDIVGRVPAEAWLPIARAFLEAYGSEETVARLSRRLVLPRGIPRLWWAVRTTYLPGAELVRRLEDLRESLDLVEA